MEYRESVINFILTIGVHRCILINWNIHVDEPQGNRLKRQTVQLETKSESNNNKQTKCVIFLHFPLICLTHWILFADKEHE